MWKVLPGRWRVEWRREALGGIFRRHRSRRPSGHWSITTDGADSDTFQPMNVNFGLFPPFENRIKGRERKKAHSDRALANLETWSAPVRRRVIRFYRSPSSAGYRSAASLRALEPLRKYVVAIALEFVRGEFRERARYAAAGRARFSIFRLSFSLACKMPANSRSRATIRCRDRYRQRPMRWFPLCAADLWANRPGAVTNGTQRSQQSRAAPNATLLPCLIVLPSDTADAIAGADEFSRSCCDVIVECVDVFGRLLPHIEQTPINHALERIPGSENFSMAWASSATTACSLIEPCRSQSQRTIAALVRPDASLTRSRADAISMLNAYRANRPRRVSAGAKAAEKYLS